MTNGRSIQKLRLTLAYVLFLTLLTTFSVFCTVPNKKRVLVIVDSNDVQDTHSKFFEQLNKRGYNLDFTIPSKISSINFSQYDEYNYDHLIIMAPKASSLGSITSKTIIDFVDKGQNNVIIVADSDTGTLSKLLREVAANAGVRFDEDHSFAIDHFHYDTKLDAGEHTTLVLDQKDEFVDREVVIKNTNRFTKKPVLFHGMAMSLKRRNPLLFPILTGSGTAYSGQKQPFVLGYNTVLVGGLQTRNGARVTYVGSMDLLSNRFFDASVNKFGSDKGSQQSGNAEFAEELSKWSLQERGVLRHRNVFHHKKNETVQPSQYRVGDDAVYSVIIEEWTGSKWEPFVANDIQVDFIMLHPYVRTFLKHMGNGKYEANIKVPDVYGCFKFKVDYRRTGYTNLIFEDGITVRPMRMNEFERFIPAAFPYYASVFSVMAGFFIFCVVFMFTGDKSKRD